MKDLTAKTFLQSQKISNLKNQLFFTQNSKPNNTMFPKSDCQYFCHGIDTVTGILKEFKNKIIGGINYGNQ